MSASPTPTGQADIAGRAENIGKVKDPHRKKKTKTHKKQKKKRRKQQANKQQQKKK
jgi:hypothetical protein